jgi:hypothetical protein
MLSLSKECHFWGNSGTISTDERFMLLDVPCVVSIFSLTFDPSDSIGGEKFISPSARVRNDAFPLNIFSSLPVVNSFPSPIPNEFLTFELSCLCEVFEEKLILEGTDLTDVLCNARNFLLFINNPLD